jgi:hypothetical protein
MPKNEQQPPPVIHARLAIDGNVLKVAESQSAFGKAVSDGLSGQPCPMLHTPKAFLFGGSDKLPVADQTRRRVAVIGVEPED